MKKGGIILLAAIMLFVLLPGIPMTAMAEEGLTTVLNATFEDDDTTAYSSVNQATMTRTAGGAVGSYSLNTHTTKDKGGAVFPITLFAGRTYRFSVYIKLKTCNSTLPNAVSFVITDSSGGETVVSATLDKALSKTDWAFCTATYTPQTDGKSVRVRIGDDVIKNVGTHTSGIFNKTYTLEFLMDNLMIQQEPVLGMSDALALDFETQWTGNFKGTYLNSTATWTNQGTHDGSAGAMAFTTTDTWGTVQFPLRTSVGNTYEISAWIKTNETPAVQNASFIIYNKSTDGNYQPWNTLAVTHTENFEAGKWVLCTATYAPTGKGVCYIDGVRSEVDVVEEGTIEFRIGSGNPSEVMNGTIAYTMDDFFVFPTVDNKLNTSERIAAGGMTTEAELTANWKSNGGNATVTWQSGGANGTSGSANVEVLGDWGTLTSRDTVPVEFGRDYRMTFWAKATCDEAVGMKIFAYLMYNEHKTSENTPNWIAIYPSSGSPSTLSADWQRYTIDFKPNSTTEEMIYPYLTFRVGAGTEKISYAVDELSIVQTGGENFNISASCSNALGDGGMFLQMEYPLYSRNYFIYRILQETNSGTSLIKVAKTTENHVYVAADDIPDEGQIRFEIVGVDAYGNCSRKTVCLADSVKPTDSIQLRADQYIWNNDISNLSATVTYDNQTKGRTLRLIGAQYNADGELVFADDVENTVSVGEKLEWQMSMPAQSTATKAKFFAWFADNVEPATFAAELDKTTTGEFIYLDANSTASSENGSFSAPYKTFNNARVALRDRVANSDKKDIYMIFKTGEYVQSDYSTIDLTSAEYSAEKNVIFTTLEGEKASFSGAKHLNGGDFAIYDSTKNIYCIDVPQGTNTRQLYVNGIKATRARSPEDAVQFTNLDYKEFEAAGSEYVFNNLGLTSTDTSFINYKYPDELELSFVEIWRHQFITVDTITSSTDANGAAVSHFGFTDDGNKAMWNEMVTLNTNAKIPVYVENALELLDEEGEWYLDTNKNKLYYKPRSFETMRTADIVIPMQTKLITLKGTPNAHAKNVSFKNIDFEYTTWNYPTEERAFRNNQNAFFSNPEGGSTMPGAVEIYDASNITFDNCDFSRIGSQALKMTGAIQYSNVIGNEFYDISGSALTLGDVTAADSAHANQIVKPTVAKFYVTDNLIANNYIHKVAADYHSAAAIGVGFPINTTIRNNEITDCPYSGMHTGYGWASYASTGTATKNFVIEKNYIHDVLNWRLYDGGALYMLGATGGSLNNMNAVRRNYFEDVKNSYGAIYPDEGSTYWNITENVINQQRYPVHYKKEDTQQEAYWLFIHINTIQHIHAFNNYSTTAMYRNDGLNNQYEAPHITSGDDWPAAAKAIMEEAGIEKTYQSRFDFGIQSLRLPRMLTVNTGETVNYTYDAATSKGSVYDTSDLEISVKNSNPAVASATKNTVSGIKAGKTWLTLGVTKKENGKVTYYDEFTFCVNVN